MKITFKKFVFGLVQLLLISCILYLIALVSIEVFNLPREEPKVKTEVEVIEITQFVSHLVKERVTFTSYYADDSMGSNAMTSSGLTIDDFKVNEKGWYIWEGRVVIATATNLCLDVSSGPCGNFNQAKDTHHYFDLFDEVTIFIDGDKHQAIVLDTCGACNWDEEFQRVDIFVRGKDYSFGKKKGAIIY